ncbi:MAG: IS1595 family transposase [Ferrimicrobium sp.]
MKDHPRGGLHYPRSIGEFQSWFATDADCLDYLAWLRWPQGFVCPRCQNPSGWVVAGGSYKCTSCMRHTAVTAGTLFDRRRTPLTVWFAVCWMFATQKDGIPALGLQRTLEIGSYQTAWAMLHRLRSVLVRSGRDRLTGTVEVDETYFGGEEPGLRGGRQKGKKVLVGVAVELREPRGLGRCRMGVLTDASATSLERFISENVEPGSNLVTDGWSSYPQAVRDHYVHKPINVKRSGQPAHVALPGVHRVASLAKRWVLGTHQGSVADPHLQSYLNEFVFRFNRRGSRSRGLAFYRLLELAVDHDPVRYRELIANSQSKKVPPVPPWRRGNPPSLDRPRVERPWRAAR